MKAFLKNFRQAPRKVRLISSMVIGKDVETALTELSHMSQKAASMLYKLIASASANAKQGNAGLQDNALLIKNITVDKGMTYVRSMPRAFGRATPINRECSHVRVTLEVTEPKTTPAPVKEDKKTNTDAKPASASLSPKATAEHSKASADKKEKETAVK